MCTGISLLMSFINNSSAGSTVVKNLPTGAGDARNMGLIPGGGNGNPLRYSCLENPTDREAWWPRVHGVSKSQTRL